MADAKISALPASTTPLAGTETLPIVQSGVTKKVSVNDLTSGKTVPANGITFPATQVPSADANTLDDYEEGTWTGTLTAATPPTTPITATGTYTKIGRLVMYNINFLDVNTTGASGAASVTGLPFTAGATSQGTVVSNAFANPTSTQIGSGSTTANIVISQTANGASITASTGRYVFITGVYHV